MDLKGKARKMKRSWTVKISDSCRVIPARSTMNETNAENIFSIVSSLARLGLIFNF